MSIRVKLSNLLKRPFLLYKKLLINCLWYSVTAINLRGEVGKLYVLSQFEQQHKQHVVLPTPICPGRTRTGSALPCAQVTQVPLPAWNLFTFLSTNPRICGTGNTYLCRSHGCVSVHSRVKSTGVWVTSLSLGSTCSQLFVQVANQCSYLSGWKSHLVIKTFLSCHLRDGAPCDEHTL